MHTKESLMKQLEELHVDRLGTVLMHSSMKSLGEVEGGADTVLDALTTYMQDGLLVLPTHTWDTVNAKQPRYSVEESPVCIGLLPEMFRKRPGVIRSAHPTHSVAAIGKDAAEFVAGDERWDTPCNRHSAWGRLLDRKATILLVGVTLARNTFIHGIEEWVDVPDRLTDGHEALVSVLADGTEVAVPSRRHNGSSTSEDFVKVDELLRERGVMRLGRLGDAPVRICDAAGLTEVLGELLRRKPDLFSDDSPYVAEDSLR
jgi:aminoglycoside 3-N-acetyltransferase